MTHNSSHGTEAGLARLRTPVLPLVGMVEMLLRIGSFTRLDDLMAELPASLEIGERRYETPGQSLEPYRDLLERLTGERQPITAQVRTVSGEIVSAQQAQSALVRQRILERELETVNSLLCGPCGCDLCCTGPGEEMEQEFFEIPLETAELEQFPLQERIDTRQTRSCRALDGTLPWEVENGGRQPRPALYRWQNGWSLILPRLSRCPHLDERKRCRIYATRPAVCRKPQIFPYILERMEALENGVPVYRLRNSLLAVTDCPYVAALRDKIAEFAAACGLEMVFRQNKG